MDHSHHNPQIDSIFIRGNKDAGVLLLHGFTGTPDSMRPLARILGEAGFTVSVPLLAGHGTTPENCAKTTWHDWYKSAAQAYKELHEQCSKVFVAGLSMGALLTLKMANDYPHVISAIACLATPLYLKPWPSMLLPIIWRTPLRGLYAYQKKFGVDIKDPRAKGNFWNYDRMPLSCIVSITELQAEIQQSLSKIHTPILLVHSRHDSTAPFESMNRVSAGVASSITETVILENSYHVITIDYDKDIVVQKVTQFFGRFL